MSDSSCQRVIDYIQGWFKQINCDGVPNRDCYMLCDESNICCMFNEILEMCDSSHTNIIDPHKGQKGGEN